MELLFTPNLFYFLFVFFSFPVLLSLPPFLGIHPLDEKYFSSEVIKCRDGSSSFPRDRLNDDFCDCTDGTDEPGTSACPTAKFYCRNVGSTPRFLFSSRVNDQICDCCDGSDEYDSTVNCPNICVMGGNIMYKADSHRSTISNQDSGVRKEIKNKIYSEDLIDTLKGLKIVISVQVGIIILWVVSRSAYRRFKSRRRHHR